MRHSEACTVVSVSAHWTPFDISTLKFLSAVIKGKDIIIFIDILLILLLLALSLF